MADRDGSTCTDKRGDTYHVAVATEADTWALADMYDRFVPKAITQGLPPADDKARLQWINDLLHNGINFIAWQDENAVGHASLILDSERNDGEYLIFVNEKLRNRGLGTELTRFALQRGGEIGLAAIWLTVEALNFRAIKLYRKMGFSFCDAGERERTMILRL
ncbi:MAG TPA: GNAT family N-acetyltransferase [Desulfomonilaceae bacterium]|nr:GNAT family N-acetyltransferase [Desulfomonilaceae bacterium]